MFKKYNSIENSYRSRTVEKFMNWHTNLENEQYIITEKIDGANIQLYFTPNQPMKIGKRTSFIGENENFFDAWNVVKQYSDALFLLQQSADSSGFAIRIFGEIYGEGIQKRIDYGPGKYMAFFDVEINGELVPPVQALVMLETHQMPTVPLVSIVYNLNEALIKSPVFTTKVGNGTDQNKLEAEGLVIRPYNKNIYLQEELFILKNKSAKFSEKMGVSPKRTHMVSPLNLEFRKYITENRVLSVFSKHGSIKEPNQIGEYIRLILEDAREDFQKDFDVSVIDKKELKSIYSVGNLVISLLKKHL